MILFSSPKTTLRFPKPAFEATPTKLRLHLGSRLNLDVSTYTFLVTYLYQSWKINQLLTVSVQQPTTEYFRSISKDWNLYGVSSIFHSLAAYKQSSLSNLINIRWVMGLFNMTPVTILLKYSAQNRNNKVLMQKYCLKITSTSSSSLFPFSFMTSNFQKTPA